jgi:hypothetical protein
LLELPLPSGRRGVALLRRDGLSVFDRQNEDLTASQIRPDGFGDAGYGNIIPPCTLCTDGADPLGLHVLSGVNTGRIIVLYFPDSDGVYDRNDLFSDDSLLYVGLDIGNGVPRIVPEGATGIEGEDFVRLDVQDVVPGDGLCNDGVLDVDFNGIPDIAPGLPFDVDATGNPLLMERWDTVSCAGGPDNLIDQLVEDYRLQLFICAPRQEVLDTNGDGQIVPAATKLLGIVTLRTPDLRGNPSGDAPIELAVSSALASTLPPASNDIRDFISTYPFEGQLLSDLAPQAVIGRYDVEFVIRHVDLLVNEQCRRSNFAGVCSFVDAGGTAVPDASRNRFLFAEGGVVTRSDADQDGENEDFITQTWGLELPQIEVTKMVRCAGTDGPFTDHADLTPGSELEFKIRVENTGNTDLFVELQDEIEATMAGTGLEFELCDPVIHAYYSQQGAAPVAITPVNVADFDNLCEDFFGVDSAAPVLSGARLPVGFLRGLDVCNGTFLGDSLEFTFCVRVTDPADSFCQSSTRNVPDAGFAPSGGLTTAPGITTAGSESLSGGTIAGPVPVGGEPGAPPRAGGLRGGTIHLTNSITAFGDPDLPASPCGPALPADNDEVVDAAAFIDTPREIDQDFDDNVVTGTVLCRDVEFEKGVRFGLNESAAVAGGAYKTGDDSLIFPKLPVIGPGFVELEYVYEVVNNGDLIEDVTVCDPTLCADIEATAAAFPAGFQVVDCQLCTHDPAPNPPSADNCLTNRLEPGATFAPLCIIRFTDQAAMDFFLSRDDGRPGCNADDKQANQPQDDSLCYRNCATVSANVANLGRAIVEPMTAGNGLANTTAAAGDTQVAAPGSTVAPGTTIVLAGTDDLLQTTPAGDDIIVGVCDGDTIVVESYAQICTCDCEIAVIKEVRCLEGPDCTTSMGPDEGWMDANDPATAKMAAPGACLEYRIRVQVTEPKAIRALRFDDVMSCPQNFETGPTPPPIIISRSGSGGLCTNDFVGQFNWTGTPAECLLPDGEPLLEDETFTVRFTARLKGRDTIDFTCDPCNQVDVYGAPTAEDCGGDIDSVEYLCTDGDDACVDIKKPDLSCDTKGWRFSSTQSCTASSCATLPDPSGPYSAPGVPVDLTGEVFPVKLDLEVCTTNYGEVPLRVRVFDDEMFDCIDAVNIAFPGAIEVLAGCELTRSAVGGSGVEKILAAGASDCWDCRLCVRSAEALRMLDDCQDGPPENNGDGSFDNHAIAVARMVEDPGDICVPYDDPATEDDDIIIVADPNTCDASILVPEECEIDVIKDARCDGGSPTAPWLDEVDALPGSRVQYRIQVRNLGERPLSRICLTDDHMGICPDLDEFELVSVMIGGVTIGGVGAPSDFDAFRPDGVTRCFDLCDRPLPARPFLEPRPAGDNMQGEVLTLIYGLVMPPACTLPDCQPDPNAPDNCIPKEECPGLPDEDPDCVNTAAAEGYEELAVLPEPPACPDEDDAAVNVKVPGIECLKEVCVDINNNGNCNDPCDIPFAENVTVPSYATYPFRLIYRVTTTNCGEVPLQNVRVCDPMLRARAQAAGYTFSSSTVMDPSGCMSLGALPPCGIVVATMSVIANDPGGDESRWKLFTDTTGAGDAACAHCADGACCLTNTAMTSASVNPTNLCTQGAETMVTSQCSATVCKNLRCGIDVEKQVRCLEGENCTTGSPDGDGWHGPGVDALDVAPGACVQYRISACNLSDCGTDLCALKFSDTLDCLDNFSLPPHDFEVWCRGALVAEPPDNIYVPATGMFMWIQPVTPALVPGECCELRFKAQLRDVNDPLLDPTCDPLNQATVQSAADNDGCVSVNPPCEPPGGPPFYTCEADSQVGIDLLEPELECIDKGWRFTSTQNCAGATCPLLPNPADPAPFSSTIDLRNVIFPVKLEMQMTGQNQGEVPLLAHVTDDEFFACVDAVNAAMPGSIDILPGCEIGTTPGHPNPRTPVEKLLAAVVGTDRWRCTICVKTAEAMRMLDACQDGCSVANWPASSCVTPPTCAGNGTYENRGRIFGRFPMADPNICLPPDGMFEGLNTQCDADIMVPRCPNLALTKQVKCAEDPDSSYDELSEALPGTKQRFRIQLTNPDTPDSPPIPVVCFTDDLGCDDWLVVPPDPNTFTARIGAEDVESDFGAWTYDGTERCFALNSRAANPKALRRGETLTIEFEVMVPDDFELVGSCPNLPNTGIDCRNTVSARAFTECFAPLNPPPGPNGPPPVADVLPPDTADINVLVPQVCCTKEVCIDFNNDGTCDTPFLDEQTIPSSAAYPFRLIYRVLVENCGEVPLNNVVVCDPELRSRAQAAGFAFVTTPAPMNPEGCIPLGRLEVCQTATATMSVTATNPEGDESRFKTFARGTGPISPDCPTACADGVCTVENTATTRGTVDTSMEANIDDQPDGLCDQGAELEVEAECSATVHKNLACMVDVIKQVRCLDDCVEPLDPEAGWLDEGDPLLEVAPGACVQYRIIATNVSMCGTDLCALKFTDMMTPEHQALFVGEPTMPVTNCGVCEPFPSSIWGGGMWICRFPSGSELPPGGSCSLTFKAQLKGPAALAEFVDDVTGLIEPAINHVNVMAAVDTDGCPSPTAPPIFTCEDDAQISIEPLPAELECYEKAWRFSATEDCVGDTCAEPAAPAGAYLSDIDLSGVVFPVRLGLLVGVRNTGLVPLTTWTTDDDLFRCIAAVNAVLPGAITFEGTCDVGTTHDGQPTSRPRVEKVIAPGGTAEWTCGIRIHSAEAMRKLDACQDGCSLTAAPFCPDVGGDCEGDGSFENLARAFARFAPAPGLCLPPGGVIEADNADCDATIETPDCCAFDLTKDVKCDGEPEDAYAVMRQAFPGTKMNHRIRLANTGTVPIARICIDDLLSPGCGAFIPGSLMIDINGDAVQLPGFDPDGSERCFTFCDRPDPNPPFFMPGETLTIKFDAILPPDCQECRNQVSVKSFTECEPGANPAYCTAPPVESRVEPLCPDGECDKEVCLDQNNTGTCTGFTRNLLLPFNIPGSFTLHYRFKAINTGDTELMAQVCDLEFVNDVNTTAGVSFVGACPLVPTGCTTLTVPAPPDGVAQTEESFTCLVQFSSLQAFETFSSRDGTPDDKCYNNLARVTFTPSDLPSDVCGTVAPFVRECENVSVCAPTCCPPCTRVVADVWNQNEIRFSGANRCFCSWDQTLLSQFNGFSPAGNHFLMSNIQTDRGKARFNGAGGGGGYGCDFGTQPAPIIGVAQQFVSFLTPENDVEATTVGLSGIGAEAGQLNYALVDPDAPVAPVTPPVLHATVGGVGSQGKLGSLLVFPMVTVEWDEQGNLVRDTFIELTNDLSRATNVQMYLVSGFRCQRVDVQFLLTPDEPAYWSAASGIRHGASGLSQLPHPSADDPAFTCPIFENPFVPGSDVIGGTFRGYVVLWATDAEGREVSHNGLGGKAMLIDYARASAAEYQPWAFRAITGPGHAALGEQMIDATGVNGGVNPGRLMLDGFEYEAAPDRLSMDFYALGAVLTGLRCVDHCLGDRDNYEYQFTPPVFVQDADISFFIPVKDLLSEPECGILPCPGE